MLFFPLYQLYKYFLNVLFILHSLQLKVDKFIRNAGKCFAKSRNLGESKNFRNYLYAKTAFFTEKAIKKK